jgi:hypothetical protein
MTRGPQPLKAQDESLPIAEKRGLVMRYQHRRGNICDFSVMSPGLVSFVCVMRLIRLSSTPEDILHDFSSVIGELRFIASSPAISRELWLRTPRGAWRFFRVLDDSLLELGRDGMPLSNSGPVKDASPANGAGPVKKPGLALHTGKKTAKGKPSAAGKDPEPVKNPEQNSMPVKVPGPEKDLKSIATPEKFPEKVHDPAPEPVPEKDPSPVDGQKSLLVPKKSMEPGKGTGPEEGTARAPDTEKIPEHIRKFLKRRNTALEKKRNPHDPATAENLSTGEYPSR